LLAGIAPISFPKEGPQTGKEKDIGRGVQDRRSGVPACKKQKRILEQRRSSVCTLKIDKEQRNITLGT